ncbi:hypothetical protein EJ04DRAFT_516227 [Polyplosphaeria fusca]|uniref:Core domain-containing protein n=1 Tax=Polyplosphaeria fusca TaxID=682080 RepID=A0A9P4QME0_9PLEO|nr:hypothetical protein EJ04DRAFT_516227 [Polyplosphaeria fusca]
MTSPINLCASCLRTAYRTAPRSITRSPPLLRPTASATAQQTLHLDFLAPSASRIPARSFSAFNQSPATRLPRNRRTLATAAATPTSLPSDPEPALATVNPRNDESGNPYTIFFSPRASARLSKLAATDASPNTALRITIESGGCHGFQYLMSLDDLSKTPPTEEDTVFEGNNGAKAVIDESSLELLGGSTIDYTMELIGSQFKVTGIPGATSSCGCGTSFDIKI